MKLTKNPLFLLLMVNAQDLSCNEQGGWKGLKVKPNPDDSDYPVNEKKDCWNIQNVSSETQTIVCESLRLKRKGVGWTLRKDGPARYCTVFNVILLENDSNYTIRGISCNMSVSTSKIKSRNTLSIALQPSFQPATIPSPFLSRNTTRQTIFNLTRSPDAKITISQSLRATRPTVNRTWAQTTSPTISPSGNLARSYYKYEFTVTAVIVPLLILCCCLCYIWRRTNKEGRAKKYYCICFSRDPYLNLTNKERSQISGESANTSASHYLNPFSKKLTFRSEKECFLIDT